MSLKCCVYAVYMHCIYAVFVLSMIFAGHRMVRAYCVNNKNIHLCNYCTVEYRIGVQSISDKHVYVCLYNHILQKQHAQIFCAFCRMH